jgi:16S rRNA (uracil1498-N3)-methyltransferase
MRVSRIYVEQPLAPGQEAHLDDRARRYIGQVLRLRAGQTLTLFNGNGTDYAAELLQCDRRDCRAIVGKPSATEPSAPLKIHLGIGISRGERMDFAIQKSVELGVQWITPLQTTRSQVRLDGARLDKRLDHWRGVIISACEQSGRNRIPQLNPPSSLQTWLEAHDQGLLLHHAAECSLPELPAPGAELNLLVGPEGGLTPEERGQAVDGGLTAVRLGPRIMRTETAPLAALAAIQTLWGDLR